MRKTPYLLAYIGAILQIAIDIYIFRISVILFSSTVHIDKNSLLQLRIIFLIPIILHCIIFILLIKLDFNKKISSIKLFSLTVLMFLIPFLINHMFFGIHFSDSLFSISQGLLFFESLSELNGMILTFPLILIIVSSILFYFGGKSIK